tara:strand:- start:210 stop:314 length:105 start_codon:yes stop_codon:yes gene_type:complete
MDQYILPGVRFFFEGSYGESFRITLLSLTDDPRN